MSMRRWCGGSAAAAFQFYIASQSRDHLQGYLGNRVFKMELKKMRIMREPVHLVSIYLWFTPSHVRAAAPDPLNSRQSVGIIAIVTVSFITINVRGFFQLLLLLPTRRLTLLCNACPRPYLNST